MEHIIVFGGILIALLFRAVLRLPKISNLNKELSELDKELADLKKELADLKETVI